MNSDDKALIPCPKLSHPPTFPSPAGDALLGMVTLSISSSSPPSLRFTGLAAVADLSGMVDIDLGRLRLLPDKEE
jgi:hypothetical protein